MGIKATELQTAAAPKVTDTLLLANSAGGTAQLTLAQAAAFLGGEMVKAGNPIGAALSTKAHENQFERLNHMNLYLYKTGTSIPVLTIENVATYTADQAVTEEGAIYGPFAEEVELSSLPDCSEALRAKWRTEHPSAEERAAMAEARVAELENQLTDTQLALCDVYELLEGGVSNG